MSTEIGFALPSTQNVTRVVLDNGLVVLAYENWHVESVSIYGSLRGGSVYEGLTRGGLASLTAEALMYGTQNRDFDALFSALEDSGADLSFSAGKHTVAFGGKALVEDLPLLLDILGDSLRYPVFPEEPFEQLRLQRMTELRYSEQDTHYRADRAFREALYSPESPYHYATYGSIESVPQLTPVDLREFHAQYYGPDGMIIVVVGAIRAEEAVAQITNTFGDWYNPDQPGPYTAPVLTPPAGRRLHVSIPGKTQSDIVIGTLGPTRYAPDYQAAVLLNSVLGEFGMMGRLGAEIREELGLAYYAYSRIEGGQFQAPWSIAAGVAPENVELAIERALYEIERVLNEPVSAEELDDNQSYFTGRLPLRLESSEGVASMLQFMERYDLGLDYLLEYPRIIGSLTADDLLTAARNYLRPEHLVIAVAGPDMY